MNFNNTIAADLTESSMLELLRYIRSEKCTIRPAQLVITEEGLAYAKELASQDPEFARRVLAELGIDLLS